MGGKKKEGESVREERKSRKKCMDLVSEEERERGVNLSCFTGRGWLQRGEGKKKKKPGERINPLCSSCTAGNKPFFF